MRYSTAIAQKPVLAPASSDQSVFHCFSRLPSELRCLIWQMSVHQRTLYINKRPKSSFQDGISARPVAPAIMHCCREARRVAPYTRSFVDGSRYAWVNFDRDIIAFHLMEWRSMFWEPYMRQIKRMRIDITWDLGFSYHAFTGPDVAHYVNLKEIFVYIKDIDGAWYDLCETSFYQVASLKQGLRFVFPDTGLMLTAAELGMAQAWIDFQSWDRFGKANFTKTPWEDLDVQYPLEDMHDDALRRF